MPHERRRLGRVIGRDGRDQVAEWCLDCDPNARGPGVWVPKHQVPVGVASLPVLRDLRSPEDRGEQRLLF